MRKHSGVTLVELLGAIVIFSIASSIIALTVSFIVNANKEIIENGKANTTGTLIIRQIENQINDLYITDYDYTFNQQLILYSDYEYIYDDSTQDIKLVNHNPRIELVVQLTQDSLQLNDLALDLNEFDLHDSSKIDMFENTDSTQFIITIVLASEMNLYTFQTTIEVIIQGS